MTDQPDLRTEHQKRISEAMKRWWAKRRHEGRTHNSKLCPGCRTHRIAHDERRCEGCDAYRDHTGHY